MENSQSTSLSTKPQQEWTSQPEKRRNSWTPTKIISSRSMTIFLTQREKWSSIVQRWNIVPMICLITYLFLMSLFQCITRCLSLYLRSFVSQINQGKWMRMEEKQSRLRWKKQDWITLHLKIYVKTIKIMRIVSGNISPSLLKFLRNPKRKVVHQDYHPNQKLVSATASYTRFKQS